MTGGVAAAGVLAVRGRPAKALVALLGTFLVGFMWAWPTLLGPLARGTATAHFALRLKEIVPPTSPLFFFGRGSKDDVVLFHLDRRVPLLKSTSDVGTHVRHGQPFFLVVSRKQIPLLKPFKGFKTLFREAGRRRERNLLLLRWEPTPERNGKP